MTHGRGHRNRLIRLFLKFRAALIMANSPKSVVVVGGGIVGLCIAVAAEARGHEVIMVAKDATIDTASGVAAGMIAPALEALGEPEPDVAFRRLKTAQMAWNTLDYAWPPAVRTALAQARADAHSHYVWPQSDNSSDITTPRLHSMGIEFHALTDGELAAVASDCDGVRVTGDWLVSGAAILAALEADFAAGNRLVRSEVRQVSARSVTLRDGGFIEAHAVVVAAGFGAFGLANDVPSLGILQPVKGHLLDLGGQGIAGVTRSPLGYLAGYGDTAKFGATMQFGQDDLAIEPDVVAGLKARAFQMLPDLDTRDAVPRTGVRASTPDAWPLIGRDSASGVLVAAGMRRNGYIFAPYAAQIVLALLGEGDLPEDAGLYDPNRFLQGLMRN